VSTHRQRRFSSKLRPARKRKRKRKRERRTAHARLCRRRDICYGQIFSHSFAFESGAARLETIKKKVFKKFSFFVDQFFEPKNVGYFSVADCVGRQRVQVRRAGRRLRLHDSRSQSHKTCFFLLRRRYLPGK